MITELASNNLIDNGVIVLQYADDIVLCLGNDMDGPWNMKLLLYLYETMSVVSHGLGSDNFKINISKSEIAVINGGDADLERNSLIFSTNKWDSFPSNT